MNENKKCQDCQRYVNPRKILNYPNSDNEKLGWRTCQFGSTIKRSTMACKMFVPIPDETVTESEPDKKKKKKKKRVKMTRTTMVRTTMVRGK